MKRKLSIGVSSEIPQQLMSIGYNSLQCTCTSNKAFPAEDKEIS